MIKFFSLLWINVFYSLPYDMTHVHQISADQSEAELARCHNYRSSALFIKLKFYAFWLFKIRGKWTVQIDGLSIICEHVFRSPSHQSSGSLHLEASHGTGVEYLELRDLVSRNEVKTS